MKKIEKIKLAPNWKDAKRVVYAIGRKDFFRYEQNHRYPIENGYELAIKHLRNYPSSIILEATYPKGILELLTSFQPYNAFIGLEKNFLSEEAHSFSYTTDLTSQIKALTNLKQIHQYGFWLAEAIEKSNFKKKKKKRLKEQISYFFEDEVTKQDYLLRDLEIIHEYYGVTFQEDSMIDLTEESFYLPDKPRTKKIPKKLRKLIEEWDENTKGIHLLSIQKKGQELIINYIWGINLFSVDSSEWHDFSLIKKAFMKGDFTIESYDNITLHQKIYKYCLKDKILNFYSHKRRTVSDKMEKLLDTKIVRKGYE